MIIRIPPTVARTGWRAFVLPYRCACCGHECRAYVVTEGVGYAELSGSLALARSRAEQNAQRRAHVALLQAQCPQCTRFQPEFVARVERGRRWQLRLNRLRLPAVIIPSMLSMFTMAVFLAYIKPYTIGLGIVGASLFASASAHSIVNHKIAIPVWAAPTNVWFWRAEAGWVPAWRLPVAPAPSALPQAHAMWKYFEPIGFLVGLGFMGIAVIWAFS